jgi:hypothetical protein
MVDNLYTVCLKATRYEAIQLMLHVDPEGRLGAGICGEREGFIMLYAENDISEKIPMDMIRKEGEFYAAPSKLYFERG